MQIHQYLQVDLGTMLSSALLKLELFLLFIVTPLVVSYTEMPFYMVFVPMFAVFIYAAGWLISKQPMTVKYLWKGNVTAERKQLKLIIIRFIILAPALLIVVLWRYLDNFLNFPLNYPVVFVLFLGLYPVLSVVPQELLYRTFFFERYKNIFNSRISIIFASTLTFSFLHVIFRNYESVLLTLIGGYLFSQTYHETRSLRLVTLEHSLYGLLVFSIGLGGFFIRGLKQAGLNL